ncbi:LOW QUALITY PROTEIN: myosin-9-like, partial [Phalaenopsis equestris]|uniref:LOW QUALITY PROTEIN: myosin-9-like n=1 Tax=Phalaenopsis equestris TaxID=78828 RepID=UPI0009E3DC92
ELKQSLQEKTSELDECLLELQLKSDAFNMENRNSEELKQLLAENKDQLENCLLDLQQKSKDLQFFTEKNCELEKCLFDLKRNSDALKQALAERDIEIEKSLLELQEKTFFALNTQNLVSSLQELASSRDKALKDIEESTHDIDFPHDLISLDIVDKIRWLVTKARISAEILKEHQRAKDVFFSVGALEAVSSTTELDSQVEWLVRSFTQSKDEVSKLQSKLKEVEILLIKLEELKVDHKNFAENLAVISSEKERFLEFLKEVTETKLDDQLSVDTDAMLEKSIVYLREKMKLSLNDHWKLENMQKLLHVTSVELTLFEKIVEELLMDGLKMTSLSEELGTALKEIYALKNEKESMKLELERLEEKNSLIRDKLSMAVKKGKGLVQEREGFKFALAEKSSEIEKLKEDLQLQESKICEYRERIKSLSAYPEQVQKLEVKVASLKDEKEQTEHFLNESKQTLKRLVDSINDIAVHTDKIFEAPIEKVEWIARRINEREIANANLEQELEKVKINADLNSNELAEALETLKSLEMDLHNKEELIHDIYDEKNTIEVSKTKVEEELHKAREESFMQASNLAGAHAAMKSLEDELLFAEDKLSALDSEKNIIVSKKNLEISALNAKLAELMEELSKTQGNSENQSAELLSELRKLQIFMTNEGLFRLMLQQFHNKVEGLKHVWMLVQDIHDNVTAKGLHIHPDMEVHRNLIPFFHPQPFCSFSFYM